MGNGVKTDSQSEKIKGFFKKNLLLMILVLLSAGAITANYYDKKNSQTINVTVDPKLVEKSSSSAEQTQKINIFVYDSASKAIESKEVFIPKQLNIIEGDFINEIIKDSPYVTKEMKFQSAYTLNMDDKNTTIVKLNSQFAGLKSDKVLFDGFSQAVTQTIMKNCCYCAGCCYTIRRRNYGSIENRGYIYGNKYR